MTKYTLFIGLNDKDTKTQKITTAEALEIIVEALKPCGGSTISEARGIYTHANGQTVEEATIRAEVLDFAGDTGAQVMSAAQRIKEALNQESVALQVEQVESILI